MPVGTQPPFVLPAICHKLGYGWLLAQGLLAAVAPRVSIRLNLKLAGMGFENVDEVEPRDWYVRAVRATGVGMVATGGIGLLLEGRAGDGDGETVSPTEIEIPGADEEPDDEDSADADDV